MFRFTRPSPDGLRRFLEAQRGAPFSYPEVGATRFGAPPGYLVDHSRARLGWGEATFRRAVVALRQWEMFRLGWVQVAPPDAPIEVGTTVAVVVRHAGLWSLNAARIVYVVDETGAVARFGFAYGTLPAHAERGEERFSLEWRRDDDSVWYDLLAFSRPSHPLAVAGYPVARYLQRRFVRDSKRAMRRAV